MMNSKEITQSQSWRKSGYIARDKARSRRIKRITRDALDACKTAVICSTALIIGLTAIAGH